MPDRRPRATPDLPARGARGATLNAPEAIVPSDADARRRGILCAARHAGVPRSTGSVTLAGIDGDGAGACAQRHSKGGV